MRLTGRPPSARLRRFAAFSLLAGLLLAPTAALNAAPPLPTPAQVSLKGGHLLTGTVTKSVKIEGKPFSVIQTDFGEILAPQSEITGTVPAVEAGDTFLAAEVRIVRLAGTVERRSAGAQEWTKVGPLDPEFTGQPRPRILPGDTVRTGADGQLDVMLHRDAWVRLEADTEVEFSTASAKGSLSLLRGATVQDVTGRPRGQTFRVTTPSTTLGVRGTRFGVFVDAEKQGVAVLKGVVRLGDAREVAAEQEARWDPLDPTAATVGSLTHEWRRRLDVAVRRLPLVEMAYVPAGRYTVGKVSLGGSSDAWALARAAPSASPRDPLAMSFDIADSIQVGAFLMDRREVTWEEYGAFIEAEGIPFRHDDADRPTTGVFGEPAVANYERAARFARWSGKALPTATQWHVAGRGMDARVFPWGTVYGPHGQPPRDELALMIPRWAADADGWARWVRFSGAHPPVESFTMDVSPFGIRSLVTSVPEWGRAGIEREPVWPLLTARARAPFEHPLPGQPPGTICGVGSSLFCITHNVGRADGVGMGFRCVVELGGR